MRWLGALALCAVAWGAAAPPKKKPTVKKAVAKKPVVKKAPVRAPLRPAAEPAPPPPLADPEMRELGVQNPAALIPFFERLYRMAEKGDAAGVHVLQFGDSHIASDDWPNAIRVRMQERFGAAGPGFVHAGRPFPGYRRYDARGNMTPGWKPRGLLNREGDGLYGLAGVALETEYGDETISLEAAGSRVEVWYWKQAGSGSFIVRDGETELGRVETEGETGPGFAEFPLSDGPHSLTLTTLADRPVRIFGWTVDRGRGVSWETLGINGAQADLALGRNERLLKEQVERRDPALIVVAYGTNEARAPAWTPETYRAAFRELIGRLRAAAPAASILVIGPPDHAQRLRGWRYAPHPGVDRIVAAQREVAREMGCAFWNLRAAMGGKGAIMNWVKTGLAQRDYVHLTTQGYRLLGETLHELLMGQYDIFVPVRKQLDR